LSSVFFYECKNRGITEVRVVEVEKNEEMTASFSSGEKFFFVPYAYVVVTAFDPKDGLILEARSSLGMAAFKDALKESEKKIHDWIQEQAKEHELQVKEGRWEVHWEPV